jgi:hypothetical protein
MDRTRFNSKIYQKLLKEGYRLFVTHRFPGHPSRFMLLPFKNTDAAIACVKSIPPAREGQLHFKASMLEKMAAGILMASYYVQMPEGLS